MAHTRGIHHCHQGDRPILGKGQVDRGLIRGMILKMVNKLIGSAKRRSIISKICQDLSARKIPYFWKYEQTAALRAAVCFIIWTVYQSWGSDNRRFCCSSAPWPDAAPRQISGSGQPPVPGGTWWHRWHRDRRKGVGCCRRWHGPSALLRWRKNNIPNVELCLTKIFYSSHFCAIINKYWGLVNHFDRI